jgi:hypothetical protein
MVKYCGYDIGKDITCEDVERLFHFLHANFTACDFIQLTQEQLNDFAKRNEAEWRFDKKLKKVI